MKFLTRAVAVAISLTMASSSFAIDDGKSEFYKKMKSLVDKEQKVLINTPEEYIYNLSTTDFIKGLMNQYASITRTIAKSENYEGLELVKKDLFTNVVCAQAALGRPSGDHYNMITDLSIKGLDEDLYKKNIQYLIDTSSDLKNLPEVPLLINECIKEGQNAKSFGLAAEKIREAKK